MSFMQFCAVDKNVYILEMRMENSERIKIYCRNTLDHAWKW